MSSPSFLNFNKKSSRSAPLRVGGILRSFSAAGAAKRVWVAL
jgi:hypothetical protein